MRAGIPVPRPTAGVVFCLALAVLFAAALVAAQGFRAQARLFPTVIGIVGLALALLQLAMELRKQQAPAPGPPAVAPFGSGEESVEGMEGEVPPEVLRRRTAALLAWVFGFAAAVWLVGFSAAVPLCTLAYLKVDARESWPTSIIFAAASGAVFYGLFEKAIRIPFDEGILITLLLG